MYSRRIKRSLVCHTDGTQNLFEEPVLAMHLLKIKKS
jgi:hypothetical protein